MGTIKDRNDMDLTEAEDIKKRWQEYTEELYKDSLQNNSKWSNWQTTNLKNIQATPPAQLQKNKWPNQKMGQRTK